MFTPVDELLTKQKKVEWNLFAEGTCQSEAQLPVILGATTTLKEYATSASKRCGSSILLTSARGVSLDGILHRLW
jgi:hypothetical protein